MSQDNMLSAALMYAVRGWEVFPLRGKAPMIAARDGGRGCLDATDDVNQIVEWWTRYPYANIGLRPPPWVVVLDTDPRAAGHAQASVELTATHGQLPRTLTHVSGRMDGGLHRFYYRPAGRLSAARLGPGFDIKSHAGYVVAPPSLHPETGRPYVVGLTLPIAPAGWLAELLVEPEPEPQRPRVDLRRDDRRDVSSSPSARFLSGGRRDDSLTPADWFELNTSWVDILGRAGWAIRKGDGASDGSHWLHPAATSDCSASIANGQLFVWSTNTPFVPSGPGDPNGYTRFHAYSVLTHAGDRSAAARAIRKSMP